MVSNIDCAAESFGVEIILAEFEDTARTLLAVKPAARDDDGGTEIKTGLKPT